MNQMKGAYPNCAYMNPPIQADFVDKIHVVVFHDITKRKHREY